MRRGACRSNWDRTRNAHARRASERYLDRDAICKECDEGVGPEDSVSKGSLAGDGHDEPIKALNHSSQGERNSALGLELQKTQQKMTTDLFEPLPSQRTRAADAPLPTLLAAGQTKPVADLAARQGARHVLRASLKSDLAPNSDF